MLNKTFIVSSAINVTALAILSYAFTILSFRPLSDVSGFVLVCAIAAFSYPCVFALTDSRPGYWSGFLIFLLVLVVAQLFGCAVYALKTHAVQHDDRESMYLFGVYLAASTVIAVLCYAPGHWVSSWIARRHKLLP